MRLETKAFAAATGLTLGLFGFLATLLSLWLGGGNTIGLLSACVLPGLRLERDRRVPGAGLGFFVRVTGRVDPGDPVQPGCGPDIGTWGSGLSRLDHP